MEQYCHALGHEIVPVAPQQGKQSAVLGTDSIDIPQLARK
jgi:hypothetical protein